MTLLKDTPFTIISNPSLGETFNLESSAPTGDTRNYPLVGGDLFLRVTLLGEDPSKHYLVLPREGFNLIGDDQNRRLPFRVNLIQAPNDPTDVYTLSTLTFEDDGGGSLILEASGSTNPLKPRILAFRASFSSQLINFLPNIYNGNNLQHAIDLIYKHLNEFSFLKIDSEYPAPPLDIPPKPQDNSDDRKFMIVYDEKTKIPTLESQIPGDLVTGSIDTKVAFPDNSLSGAKLEDNTVPHSKLTADAVEEDNIKDGSVTNPKLGDVAPLAGTGLVKDSGASTNTLKLDERFLFFHPTTANLTLDFTTTNTSPAKGAYRGEAFVDLRSVPSPTFTLNITNMVNDGLYHILLAQHPSTAKVVNVQLDGTQVPDPSDQNSNPWIGTTRPVYPYFQIGRVGLLTIRKHSGGANLSFLSGDQYRRGSLLDITNTSASGHSLPSVFTPAIIKTAIETLAKSSGSGGIDFSTLPEGRLVSLDDYLPFYETKGERGVISNPVEITKVVAGGHNVKFPPTVTFFANDDDPSTDSVTYYYFVTPKVESLVLLDSLGNHSETLEGAAINKERVLTVDSVVHGALQGALLMSATEVIFILEQDEGDITVHFSGPYEQGYQANVGLINGKIVGGYRIPIGVIKDGQLNLSIESAYTSRGYRLTINIADYKLTRSGPPTVVKKQVASLPDLFRESLGVNAANLEQVVEALPEAGPEEKVSDLLALVETSKQTGRIILEDFSDQVKIGQYNGEAGRALSKVPWRSFSFVNPSFTSDVKYAFIWAGRAIKDVQFNFEISDGNHFTNISQKENLVSYFSDDGSPYEALALIFVDNRVALALKESAYPDNLRTTLGTNSANVVNLRVKFNHRINRPNSSGEPRQTGNPTFDVNMDSGPAEDFTQTDKERLNLFLDDERGYGWRWEKRKAVVSEPDLIFHLINWRREFATINLFYTTYTKAVEEYEQRKAQGAAQIDLPVDPRKANWTVTVDGQTFTFKPYASLHALQTDYPLPESPSFSFDFETEARFLLRQATAKKEDIVEKVLKRYKAPPSKIAITGKVNFTTVDGTSGATSLGYITELIQKGGYYMPRPARDARLASSYRCRANSAVDEPSSHSDCRKLDGLDSLRIDNLVVGAKYFLTVTLKSSTRLRNNNYVGIRVFNSSDDLTYSTGNLQTFKVGNLFPDPPPDGTDFASSPYNAYTDRTAGDYAYSNDGPIILSPNIHATSKNPDARSLTEFAIFTAEDETLQFGLWYVVAMRQMEVSYNLFSL